MNRTAVFIEGMHCASCEKTVKEELSRVEQVKGVDIDLRRKKAQISFTGDRLDIDLLNSKIVPLGYTIVSEKTQAAFKPGEWVFPVSITIALVAAFVLLQHYIPAGLFRGADGAINYPFAFITGLAASVSSCLAVTGAIVIAFGGLYKTRGLDNTPTALIKPNVLFHAGRLITFFALGGLLGAIGGELSLSGRFVGITGIVVALVMLALGLNMLGAVPSINAMGIKMPDFFTRPLARLKESTHRSVPLILGFFTFFLPCGFTQSMQIFALGSGSFMQGALYMFLFAMGTVPVLFAMGVTAAYSRHPRFTALRRTGALLIILFGIYTLMSGIAVIDFKGNLFAVNKTSDIKTPAPEHSVSQTVKMRITYAGFSPQVIKINKGVPVRWEIYGDEVTGCTNAVIFPYINKRVSIKRNDVSIIEFTPEEKGELPFSCWMGMVRGKFIVE